jgi:hypothetical protein
VGAHNIERSAAAVFHGVTTQGMLAEQFRRDVARASAAPQKAENRVASPTCLILCMTNGDHVIYRWDSDHLERTEKTNAETFVQRIPLGDDRLTVEFSRSGKESRLITMHLSEPEQGAPALRARGRNSSLEIAATLGGDLR